ncbi:MAG: AI-2E family transporter [Alphaproteobacteria bacterium]|nr:AI-2E family transporter [Alphaproteobacteria bacterium]
MTYTPLKPKTHLIFWTGTSLVFVALVFLFKTVLLPFVLGLSVAYLLNPLVNKLCLKGLSRSSASLLILGCFLVILLILGFLLVPALIREMAELIDNAPAYAETLTNLLKPAASRIEAFLGVSHDEAMENLVKNGSGPAVKTLNVIIKNLLAGGQAMIDALSVAVIMPIVAYFLMKDWPRMISWVHGLVPRHAEETVNALLRAIDEKLSGFVRGQITVAVILGLAYALILTIVGLKYGFLIGLGSGFLSIIPMVGSTVGLVTGIAIAWLQSGNLAFVLLIGAIFLGGQAIEGNFLTPKLIGESVGLHPLWIFFSVMAGASLLGILGMFLAVPVAAVIGVIASFLLQKYKESRYYNDLIPAPPDQPDPKPQKAAARAGRQAAKSNRKKTPKNDESPRPESKDGQQGSPDST